jgi:hypothetical protein
MVTSTVLADLRGKGGERLCRSKQANQSEPPNQPGVGPKATSMCSGASSSIDSNDVISLSLKHPAFNWQQAKTPTTALLFAWPPATIPVLMRPSSLANLRIVIRAAVGISLLALTACYGGPNLRDCSHVEDKINPRLLQRVEVCQANPPI